MIDYPVRGLQMPSVEPAEKDRFRKIARMTGWEIAALYGVMFDGDADPWTHDGTFYNLDTWEEDDSANIVRLYRHPKDPDRYLVVQPGTCRKKTGKEAEEVAKRIREVFDTNQVDDPNLQFLATYLHWGADQDPDDAITYDLNNWPKKWRFWRSIDHLLKNLKG